MKPNVKAKDQQRNDTKTLYDSGSGVTATRWEGQNNLDSPVKLIADFLIAIKVSKNVVG